MKQSIFNKRNITHLKDFRYCNFKGVMLTIDEFSKTNCIISLP